ncbi:MAG: XisH family protein [Haliscomenobacter sp.]|nr:element excision factor XisH family protein [Haliscomenobacter sp.]MBK9488604.1 XisH family protein [Haliscomenobacter sp.]
MAKDLYHRIVKEALELEGWKITHDPYKLSEWDPDWEIDLGAERLIAAEKDTQLIAIEVKSFLEISFAYEFHRALGQYINYRGGLKVLDPSRILYIAVPIAVYETECQRRGVQFSLQENNVKIIVYNSDLKKIEQWIE